MSKDFIEGLNDFIKEVNELLEQRKAKEEKDDHWSDADRYTFQYKPKKQGHWEECEVIITGDKPYGYFFYRYKVKDIPLRFNLHDAFSMVGFGGIQFEEWPNYWYPNFLFVNKDGIAQDGTDAVLNNKPATPAKVRFWVEG